MPVGVYKHHPHVVIAIVKLILIGNTGGKNARFV